MAISTRNALLACIAVGAFACAAQSRHDGLQPIDICLTVGHPDPCVGYSDSQGDGWAIVEMAGGADLPSLPDGTQFRVTGVYCTSCIHWFCGSFEGNIFEAQIHPACPVLGDASGDGIVDVNDLLSVIGAWGQCPPVCLPDLNADSTVDIDDLLIVISHWA